MQRMGRQLVWAAVLAMTTSVISVPPAVAGTRGGHNQEDRNRDRDRNQDRNRGRDRNRDRGRDHDRGNDHRTLTNGQRDRNKQVDDRGHDRNKDDHGRGRRHDG